MSRITIDGLPDRQPEWASGGGASITEPGLSDKQSGWIVDEEPPAPWFNYWMKNVWLMIRLFLSSIVSNLREINTGPGTTVPARCILYHPVAGNLIVAGVDNNKIFRSENGGFSWEDRGALSPETMAFWRVGAIDSTSYIFGTGTSGTDMRLGYSTNGGTSWTVKAITNPPTGQAVTAIGTGEYNTNDKIVIGGSAGDLMYAADVTSTFYNPTTAPSETVDVVAIRKCNSVWVALYENGNTYRTTDDGDNWSASSDAPADLTGSNIWRHMAAAPDSERARLVAVGEDTSNDAIIGYSDDNGNTWSLATIDLGTSITDGRLYAVYYIGADTWIATGEENETDASLVLISNDGGRNWHKVDWTALSDGIAVHDMTCDGKRLWFIGSEYFVGQSLAMGSPAIT